MQTHFVTFLSWYPLTVSMVPQPWRNLNGFIRFNEILRFLKLESKSLKTWKLHSDRSCQELQRLSHFEVKGQMKEQSHIIWGINPWHKVVACYPATPLQQDGGQPELRASKRRKCSTERRTENKVAWRVVVLGRQSEDSPNDRTSHVSRGLRVLYWILEQEKVNVWRLPVSVRTDKKTQKPTPAQEETTYRRFGMCNLGGTAK